MRELTNTFGTIPETLLGQESWWRDVRKRSALLALLAITALIAFLALYGMGSTQAQNPPATTRSLTLTWADSGGGSDTGYQYSTDHGVTWNDISFTGGAFTERMITGPTPGTATVFLLRATGDSAPKTARSTAGTGETTPALAAQGTGPQTITLVWTEPTQGAGTPVALYELDWSTDGSDGTWQRLARVNQAEGNSYDDNEAHAGATYHYRVRAADASFNYGPWSETASATVLVPEPNTPVLTATAVRPGTILLTWAEPADAREGTTLYQYHIEWSPDGTGGSWQALTKTLREKEDNDHEDHIEYGETRHYRIRMQDTSLNYSPWSNTASATATFPAPYDPYVTSRPAGTDSVYLEWQKPYDEGTPILRYELGASSDGGNTFNTLASNLPATALHHTHGGLNLGDVMVHRLRACSAAGCSEWGVTSSVTVGENPAPLAPVLTAEARSSSIIGLTWTQPETGGSSVIRYDIEFSKASNPDWHNPESTWVWDDQLGYEHQNLNPGTTVSYRVRANSDAGDGAWSAVKTATTNSEGTPDAPTGLTATVAGDHRVDLEWTAPVYADGITGYRLERRNMDTSQLWEVAATTTGLSYSDTGLDGGTGYEYRVAAINEAGTGEYSLEANARTTGTAVRGNAPLLHATPEYGAVALSWDEPAPGLHSCPISRYEIERSNGPPPFNWELLWEVDAGRDNTFHDYVTPGEAHYYQVRAIDSCGTASPWSRHWVAESLHWPPHAPWVYGIVAGVNSVHVEWQEHYEDETPVTNQELEYSVNGGPYLTLNANMDRSVLSYTHTGLTPGDRMTYRLRATNIGGYGEWGYSDAATVGASPVPLAPILTAEIRSSAIIKLSWTKPDSSLPITAYELYESADGWDWQRGPGYFYLEDRHITIEGLEAGTTTYYRIRAYNENGMGIWSDVIKTTTISGAPTAPANLTATVVDDHRIDLSWDAQQSDNGAITYRVERIDVWANQLSWDEAWETVGTVSANSYSDTRLYQGSWYAYRVVGTNNAGKGAYSDVVEERTTGDGPDSPGLPTMLRFVSFGANEATIAWNAPEFDGNRPLTGYRYEVRNPSCGDWTTTVYETSETQARITGLPECVSGYHFKVRALNAVYEGEWTLPEYARVPTSISGRVIVTPTALTVTEGGAAEFTVRLGQAPTKALEVYLDWEGDYDITDSIRGDGLQLTPENWSEGVTIRLDAAEDDDSVNGTALIHVHVQTHDPRLPSEKRDNPTVHEPVFSSQAGASVVVIENDND